jgi:hypothetical protein
MIAKVAIAFIGTIAVGGFAFSNGVALHEQLKIWRKRLNLD